MNYDVLLIGGSGFVGQTMAAQLESAGYSVLIPTRRIAAANDLRLLPKVSLLEADIFQEETLLALCRQIKPQGAVINLVGILQDKPAKPYGLAFKKAHLDLPKLIIKAMEQTGLRRYLHMSALGADSNGPSMYQRSKGDGEKSVVASNLDWTIFRPSVIFGEKDQFINTFSSLAKIFPIIPLAHSEALFQPVSVRDVAKAFVMSLDTQHINAKHKIFELVGPRVMSMKELVQFAAKKVGAFGKVIPLPAWVGYCQALMFEYGPGPTLMSRDNIASMQQANILPVHGHDALTEDFGISKQAIESLLK